MRALLYITQISTSLRRSSYGQPLVRKVILSLLWVGALACHDLSGLAGTQPLPAGVSDPSVYHTPAGARTLYQTALEVFSGGSGTSIGTDYHRYDFGNFIIQTGLLTDELQAGNLGGVNGLGGEMVDARRLPEGVSASTDGSYVWLQQVRAATNEGIGALLAYDDTAPPALRGQLYALQGYAEIMLADLFCSGVPLSTLDFNADYTYHAGSTTTQIYGDAIAKFDTAITLSGDSARILYLAQVGKGRALLALGSLSQAAATVASIPQGFTYQVVQDWQGDYYASNFVNNDANVSNREGTNGLPYRSNGDPRDSVQQASTNAFGVPQFVPLKYGGATPGPELTTVADWIEARLIQAEAALNAGNTTTWLNDLNQLRTNGDSSTITYAAITVFDTSWVTGCTNQPNLCTDSVPTGTSYAGFTIDSVFDVAVEQGSPAWQVCWADNGSSASDCNNPLPVVVYSRAASSVTTYQAGTGGVSGLAPLTDPGDDSARVSMLFQERAYWLFLTGHRQGDLRRLIRQYHRPQNQVYPTGPYPSGNPDLYGSYVDAPIPSAEHENPLFTGCLSRGD